LARLSWGFSVITSEAGEAIPIRVLRWRQLQNGFLGTEHFLQAPIGRLHDVPVVHADPELRHHADLGQDVEDALLVLGDHDVGGGLGARRPGCHLEVARRINVADALALLANVSKVCARDAEHLL
jgi:hypothetical protein